MQIEAVSPKDRAHLAEFLQSKPDQDGYWVPEHSKCHLIEFIDSIIFESHLHNQLINKYSILLSQIKKIIHNLVYSLFSFSDFRALLEAIDIIDVRLSMYEDHNKQLSSHLLCQECQIQQVFHNEAIQKMGQSDQNVCRNSESLGEGNLSQTGGPQPVDSSGLFINTDMPVKGSDTDNGTGLFMQKHVLKEELPDSPKFYGHLLPRHSRCEETDQSQSQSLSEIEPISIQTLESVSFKQHPLKTDTHSTLQTLYQSKQLSSNPHDHKHSTNGEATDAAGPKTKTKTKTKKEKEKEKSEDEILGQLSARFNPRPSFLASQNIQQLTKEESADDVNRSKFFHVNNPMSQKTDKTVSERMYAENIKMVKLKNRMSSRKSSRNSKGSKGSKGLCEESRSAQRLLLESTRIKFKNRDDQDKNKVNNQSVLKVDLKMKKMMEVTDTSEKSVFGINSLQRSGSSKKTQGKTRDSLIQSKLLMENPQIQLMKNRCFAVQPH